MAELYRPRSGARFFRDDWDQIKAFYGGMFGIHNYWLFILSGILLNIVPGQDTLYIIGRSISQGRSAGFLSVLGISTGCLIHTLAAAFGLSAVLAASSHAFMTIRFIGAAYLIYLGIRMLFSGGSAPGPSLRYPFAGIRMDHLASGDSDQRSKSQCAVSLAFFPNLSTCTAARR